MKHSIILLIIGALMFFLGCSENNPTGPEFTQSDQVTTAFAKKPLAKLIGPMELTFTFANRPYVWDGTVTFGEDVLGIRFQSLSKINVGQSSHFEENFEIYDLNSKTTIYMKGPDAGVTSLANSKFRMNGVVEEANFPFEEWLGRSIHISGLIIWSPDGPLPAAGLGTVRIN